VLRALAASLEKAVIESALKAAKAKGAREPQRFNPIGDFSPGRKADLDLKAWLIGVFDSTSRDAEVEGRTRGIDPFGTFGVHNLGPAIARPGIFNCDRFHGAPRDR
jgi:hypothetical protein